jgi:TPR repeat protein
MRTGYTGPSERLEFKTGGSRAEGFCTAQTAFLKKACQKESTDSCIELAKMYLAGLGTKQDAELARHYAEVACKRGSEVGCMIAGRLWKENGKSAIAFEYYKRSCGAGNAGACLEAARASPDFPSAPWHALQACNAGIKAACEALQATVARAEQKCNQDQTACTLVAQLKAFRGKLKPGDTIPLDARNVADGVGEAAAKDTRPTDDTAREDE